VVWVFAQSWPLQALVPSRILQPAFK